MSGNRCPLRPTGRLTGPLRRAPTLALMLAAATVAFGPEPGRADDQANPAPTAASRPIDCAGPGQIDLAARAAPVGPAGAVRPGFEPAETGPGLRLDGVIVPATADRSARAALGTRLADAAGRGTIAVRGADGRADRHGRISGQAEDASGAWIQAALVRDGLALGDGTGPCAAALLAVEAEARKAGRGLWAEPRFRVRIGPGGRARTPADFVIAEGRLESVGIAGRTTYLNFGWAFGRDFTILIDGRTYARFDADNRPETWAGRWIRVRGWAVPDDGGTLRLADVGAIEVTNEERDTRLGR
ncbi:thermonuclease family protein [Chthonobacter rhizosphaerae]|uniref:thermonuclease family protein n=1 Tax=Chthonobacter rhizosphaerae TaxID=2735553 RepID=UPI0015EE5043|nr:thermonuclease family protein [Chthonobacter rhizosphaerae]